MAQPVRNWIAANKFYLTPLLLLTGLLTLLWAYQFQPAPASSLSSAIYAAHYVGPLDLKRARGGILHAGYGIGWRTDRRGPPGGVPYESFARFSYALSLTEEDIAKVRAAGPPYEVGMHDGVIVTLAGAGGSVISYEDYTARATERRNQLLALGIGLLIVAASTFFVRSEAPRPS